MHNLEDVTRLPEDFDGRVRLFPLPDLVLFPHSMQPLHLFEPRYCEMLADSLEDDRMIAMATLTGGMPIGETQDPPIASTVCLGKIISHAEVDGDKHNILLVGTRRAKVLTEIETGRPFRMAEVQVADDIYPPSGTESRLELKKELLQAFGTVMPISKTIQQNLHELMAGQMSLGPITDIIAYTLPFGVEQKLKLLADPDVDSRAAELVRLLSSGAIDLDLADIDSLPQDPDSSQQFPPPFSLN